MALNLLGAMQKSASVTNAFLPDTPPVEMVPLAALVLDPGLQVRVTLSESHIETDLRVKIREGERLHPIQVARYQDALYVVAGFHRVEAHKREGKTRIEAEIYTANSRRDLLTLALPTNADHGLVLTREDNVRKVHLAIAEWRAEIERGELSDQQLARMCKVSPSLVSEVRRGLVQAPTTKQVQRGGTTYTMKAERIGRPRHAKPIELAEQLVDYLDAAFPDDADALVQTLTTTPPQDLALQAALPVHKPAALAEALATVVSQRSVTIRLAPATAKALLAVLAETAPALADLVRPQVEGEAWDSPAS